MTDILVIEERVVTNVETPPPQRQLPVSTVQLAAATSDAVITGLAKSPYLLGVIVIVLVGVGAAIYFLQILITGQATHLKSLLEVQNRQQTEIITLHKQEFDALLEMANRLSTPMQSPIAPNSQTLTQPPARPR